MQRQLKDKEEEIERLKMMIRDKQLEKNLMFGRGEGDDEQFNRISKEIDQIKFMILSLKDKQQDKPKKQERVQFAKLRDK